MRTLLYITVIQGMLYFCNVQAQERPPINNFSTLDYGAGSQNWSITQDNTRYIYVANNKGLLEYNGTKWSLYPSPNETILRAVNVINGLVYTGAYHEFGYWKRDNYGLLNYTSLSTQLGVTFYEDEEFWNILYYDTLVLFQSLDRIHIYNIATKAYHVLKFKAHITKIFKVKNDFYFQSLHNGLYKISNGSAILISDDIIVKDQPIVNIHTKNDEPLLLTQSNGFYTLEDNILKPWDSPANTFLQQMSAFTSKQLQDNSFAIGTISNGIVHINQNGTLNFQITQINGLTNNTVLSIHEDLDSNLWLGLDNGIDCINMESPYRIYNDEAGTFGSLYASIVHKGILYLGTNQGLFYRNVNSTETLKFITGTEGQVWFLGAVGNELFCGHNSGTFTINTNSATKISSIPGTWQVKEVPEHPNLLITGNYEGLYILQKNEDKWQLRNKLEGFDISSRYFEFLNDTLIAINHEYKGVFKLKINKGLTKVLQHTIDSSLVKGINSSLIKHHEAILYANANGVFKYIASSNSFKKDTILSKLIDVKHFTSAKLVSEPLTNSLWSFSAKGINTLSVAKLSGTTKLESIPFSVQVRNDVSGYESVTYLNDQTFLLGSKKGYIVCNLDKREKQDHEINITNIALINQKDNNTTVPQDLKVTPFFQTKENSIAFSYSVFEFLKTQQPEYQYKLEGIYEQWSNWNNDGFAFFENLPFGKFTFLVRGRVGNQHTINVAAYSFEINRPWYYSNIALVGYVLAVVLFSFFMHNLYKRYYRAQQERVLKKTTREYELRELENKQQLMRFRNDKLREDVETKNRELGVSTMNLIKKNEFLNTIKSELEAVDDHKKLKRVIKIIDKNLNNNDDWNLFQEAFNNADKDFLKKIKSLHPNLTANDLRLCAYLRLNLSSKEIAPLLNISPRSVEVKRYRLRKKMDLSHEASLTDYILEV